MRGFTLVEVIVVLALLGLIVGVSGLALGSLRAPPQSMAVAELRQAQADAIRTGVARAARGVLFLPDGRGVGTNVDPLTGTPDAR